MNEESHFKKWEDQLYPENAEYIDPELLSDEDVFDMFFSQLNHPATAMMQSNDIGEYIQDLLGARHADDSPSKEQVAWRERMMSLMDDSDGLSDAVIDGLLLEGDRHDEPFTAIVSSLLRTRNEAKHLPQERKALLLLKDLRMGAIRRELNDESSNVKWMKLIDRLCPTNEL